MRVRSFAGSPRPIAIACDMAPAPISRVSEATSARFDLADAIAVLERTPAAFRGLLERLPAAWTTPNEGPDTFSAFDNLGHLVHGERTDWIPRARIILEHGRARPFDPYDRFAQVHESRG